MSHYIGYQGNGTRHYANNRKDVAPPALTIMMCVTVLRVLFGPKTLHIAPQGPCAPIAGTGVTIDLVETRVPRAYPRQLSTR